MAKVLRLEKIYERVDGNGAVTKERTGEPNGRFSFVFKETGNRFDGSVFQIPGMTSEIWASLPTVVKNLTMHGIMQKCGDPAAGETGEDVEEAVTGLCEMVLAGNFYAEREKGEARPSMLAEAVWEYKREQGQVSTNEAGVEIATKKDGTTETLADIIARYAGKDGAPARKLAMQNSRVKVILAKMREDAARKRREQLEAKAGTAEAQTDASEL